MRIVLDTNVIVSGLNYPGNERLVLDMARRGRFHLYLSPFILNEVGGVLARKFAWDEEKVFQALRMLRSIATLIEPRRRPYVIKDHHADNRILECAEEVSADYLITGDKQHLLPLGKHGRTRIVNAPRFLTDLQS